MKPIIAGLSLLVVSACAAPQLRDRDEAQGTCTLSDERSGLYTAPQVLEPGAYPRLPHPPPAEARILTGAYDCLVRTNGQVAHCRVLKSVPGADEFAAGALSSWRFSPATCAGEPVPARTVITLQPRYIPVCAGVGARAQWDTLNEKPRANALAEAKRLEEAFGQGQHPFAVQLPEDQCVTSDGREGVLSKLKLLSEFSIRYPQVAIENRQDGTIIARCVIRAGGNLESCELVCSDVPAAEGVVLRDLSGWRMSPPVCGEEPVELVRQFPFLFKRPH